MSSLWFVLADYEREPFEGYDEETARKIAARRDEEQPKLAPHRVVRYDLADAERDKRDADAIDFILNATRPQTTEALNAYLIRLGAARKRLEALRDRLRGGGK